MNWEAIGAIGEIVGALAVFLTLAYLAIQIRQNTSAVRTTALDSSVNVVQNIREQILNSEEVATIYIEGGKDPHNLSEVDLVRYRILITNMLWSIWNLYSQSNYGSLSKSVWECQRTTLHRILETPGGKWYWNEYGCEFEDTFIEEINSIIASWKSK